METILTVLSIIVMALMAIALLMTVVHNVITFIENRRDAKQEREAEAKEQADLEALKAHNDKLRSNIGFHIADSKEGDNDDNR